MQHVLPSCLLHANALAVERLDVTEGHVPVGDVWWWRWRWLFVVCLCLFCLFVRLLIVFLFVSLFVVRLLCVTELSRRPGKRKSLNQLFAGFWSTISTQAASSAARVGLNFCDSERCSPAVSTEEA